MVLLLRDASEFGGRANTAGVFHTGIPNHWGVLVRGANGQRMASGQRVALTSSTSVIKRRAAILFLEGVSSVSASTASTR